MNTVISLVTGVLGSAVVVLGFVALVGLIAMKKKGTEVFLGTVKTMIGFEILMGGGTLIVSALNPLSSLIQAVFHVQGITILIWPAFSETMAKLGTQTALVFLFSFIVNIILARITKLKFVALTVHLQLFWAGFIVVLLDAVHITGVNLYIIATILVALYYWLNTAISYYFMKDTMTDQFATYVPSIFGIIVSGIFGKIFFHNKGRSTEEMQVPASFEWLKETVVSMSVVMLVFYLILGLSAGLPYVAKLSGGQNFFVYILSQSLLVGGSVGIILYGVRMLLAEIIPAFNGIALKLLPNAKMGLDYPTVYNFAPTAVMLGFLFHFLGSLLAMVLMALIHFSPFVVTGVQINFFEGALLGVFANYRGGIKNVILTCLVIGFILPFGVAFLHPYSGILSNFGYAYECIDFNTIGLFIAYILHFFH